jgi:RNA polymerase-binding transcription factor DksA
MRPKKTLQTEVDKMTERAKLSLEENKVFMYEKYDEFQKKKKQLKLPFSNPAPSSSGNPADQGVISVTEENNEEQLTEEEKKLKQYIEETKEKIEEKKKEMYLEEHIPVRKIVGSELFNGFIPPESLVIPPKVSHVS